MNWYAIQVRPRREFYTATLLQYKGYNPFVPRYESRRQWSDRIARLELPLFPGYIFCKFDVKFKMPIITTTGVIKIVGKNKMPLPISVEEIEAVCRITEFGYRAEPHPFPAIGTRVRIGGGPLAGIEGIVKEYRNRQLVVSISLIQQCMSVKLQQDIILLPSQTPSTERVA